MKYYKILISTLFVIFLIIPLAKINFSDISERENRALAKFPQYLKNDSINNNFGKEFERWLGDRFWGRNAIIDLNFQFRYKVNGKVENDDAFIGIDGWMFKKDDSIRIGSSDNQKNKVLQRANIVRKINTYFEKKHIPLYVFIFPQRSEIYMNYYKELYDVPPRIAGGKLLKELLADNKNIRVIDLGDKQYIKNDIEYYMKTDSHQTLEASKDLIKEIVKSISNLDNIEILLKSRKNGYYSDIAALLGMSINKEEYKFKIEPNNYTKNKEIHHSGAVLLGLYSSDNAKMDTNLNIIDACFVSNSMAVWANLYKNVSFFRGNLKFSDDEEFEVFRNGFNEFIENISDGIGVVIITDLIAGDEFSKNFQRLFFQKEN